MPYLNTNTNKKEFPWMAQVKINGQKKRKQFKTKKEALAWELEQRKSRPEEILLTDTISLHEWAAKYLDFSKRKYVRKTYMEKLIAFRMLLNYEEVDPDSPACDIEPFVILSHLQDQEAERSGNAANKDRKNLRAGWEWGVKILGLPPLNPFSLVSRFAEKRFERPVPTIQEFLMVLDAAKTDQDYLMLLAYLYTAARREELFRLKWKDVDFKNSQIRLACRKNNDGEWWYDWITLDDRLMGPLKAHQKKTGLQGFVFLNMQGSEHPNYWIPYQWRQHWLKGLCEDAGVKQFGFHGIRHLCASILAAENVPLVKIQNHLRHRHLTTTQRYIHNMDRKENLEVLKALPDLEDNLKRRPIKRPIKTEQALNENR